MISKALGSLALIGMACTASAAPPAIARVESGLLPPITIVGEPTRTMNVVERMAHYRVPAISIALIENYDVAWARAYGTLASAGAVPATTDTLFQAGSISKPVAAAAALSLASQGRLSLDAPISDFLTSWQVPVSEASATRPVTLRAILSHTAGFTVHGFRGYAAGEPVPTLLQILDGEAPANSQPIRVDQAPGTALRYSGGGYTVMQQLIEDVSARSFADVVGDEVLRRIGMTRSTYQQSLPERLLSQAAIGHKPDGSPVEGGWYNHPEMAAAGLWSTASDLARFTAWLMNNAQEGSSSAQHAIADGMLQPQRNASGGEFTTPAGNKAGLGLVLDGEGVASHFSHAGSNPGYRSFMIGFPETGQGAVIMANADSSPALIQEILRSLAAEYRWPERFHQFAMPVSLDENVLKALAGTYRFESRGQGRVLEIYLQSSGGVLVAELPDGTGHRLRPLSETRFVDPVTELTLIFDPNGALRVPAYGIVATREPEPSAAAAAGQR